MTKKKTLDVKSRIDKKMNKRSLLERCFNKKGSSLVLALVVIAIISILSTLVLTLSLNAYRTSVQNKWADEDFYYCEDYLEQVRQSLVSSVNDIILVNYKAVSAEFSTSTTEQINSKFRNQIYANLKDLAFNSSKPDTGLLNKTIYLEDEENAAAGTDPVIIGELKISFDADYYRNNSDAAALDESKYKYVFKDVKVEYWNGNRTLIEENQKKYYASVTTDIVIYVPSLGFDEEENYNGSLSYILVSGGNTSFSGQSNVEGNVYVGSSLKFNTGADVQFLSDYITVCNQIENYSTFEVYGHSASANIWCKDIIIPKTSSTIGTSTIIDGNLFVNDDVEINGQNSYVQISGKYYGYGDGTGNTEYKESQANGVITNSSVLVNGQGTTLDLTGLSELVLSGHSFFSVGGSKQYETSESLATIVSQSIYMVNEKYVDFSGTKVFVGEGDNRKSVSFADIKTESGTTFTQLLTGGYKFVTGGVDISAAGLGISENDFAQDYLCENTSTEKIVTVRAYTIDGNNYCCLYWNFAGDNGIKPAGADIVSSSYIDLNSKTFKNVGLSKNLSDVYVYENGKKFTISKSAGSDPAIITVGEIFDSTGYSIKDQYEYNHKFDVKYGEDLPSDIDLRYFASDYLNDAEPVRAVVIAVETDEEKVYKYELSLQWNFDLSKTKNKSAGDIFISKCINAGLVNGFLEKFMDGGYIKISPSATIDTETNLYEYMLNDENFYAASLLSKPNSSSLFSSSAFAENLSETYKWYMTTLIPEKYNPFGSKFNFVSADIEGKYSIFNRKVASGKKYIDMQTIDNWLQTSDDYDFVSDLSGRYRNLVINGNLKVDADGNWFVGSNRISGVTDSFNSFEGIIFVNGTVTIDNGVTVKGMIVSNGDISISKGTYVFDEDIVKGCLDVIKAHSTLKDLVSDEFYASNTDTATNSESLNAADYIKYENWTRNKDKY